MLPKPWTYSAEAPTHSPQSSSWLSEAHRTTSFQELEQKEEAWVLPLQNFEARKILRESHTGEVCYLVGGSLTF